jgi:hypothetical protein
MKSSFFKHKPSSDQRMCHKNVTLHRLRERDKNNIPSPRTTTTTTTTITTR